MNTSGIFLSYRSIEADFALKLAADLKNAGVSLWMDRLDGIQVGMDWRNAIQEAINGCTAMIAVISPDYVQSAYCRNELARADALRRPIFPIMLHPVRAEDWPMEIQRVQYEDFTQWRDDLQYSRNLGLLVARLRTGSSHLVGNVPDAETRYLTSLIAELESRRGVLEYVELSAEAVNSPPARPEPKPIDEWGFALLEEPKEGMTDPHDLQKHPLTSIAEAVQRFPRFVLIGEPGAGKTTTIRRLALEAARQHLENPRVAPIPLLIYLPQWNNEATPLDFVRSKWPFTTDPAQLLQHGDILLYLDGLNEMGADGIRKAALLARWIASSDSPRRMVVTCRSGDYTGHLRLGELPVVLAQELDQAQIRQFAASYLKDSSNAFLARILPEEVGSLQGSSYGHGLEHERQLSRLVRNPYMLGVLIYLYEHSPSRTLPTNNGALFSRLASALWERERQRNSPGWIPFAQAEQAFGNLAFSIIDENQPVDVPLDYALSRLGDRTLLQLGESANFLTVASEQVHFYHQLMLEYFAARAMPSARLEGDLEQPEFRLDGPLASKWEQVIIALCGITPDPDALVGRLAARNPYLAARCVGSGIQVSAAVRQEIEKQLREDLRRLNAVSVVSYLKQIPALAVPALLDNLWRTNDVDRNAPEALALAEMRSAAVPELIEALEHSSKVVRTVAARALGQIGSRWAVSFLEELSSDTEPVMKDQRVCDFANAALRCIAGNFKYWENRCPECDNTKGFVFRSWCSSYGMDGDWYETEEYTCSVCGCSWEHESKCSEFASDQHYEGVKEQHIGP